VIHRDDIVAVGLFADGRAGPRETHSRAGTSAVGREASSRAPRATRVPRLPRRHRAVLPRARTTTTTELRCAQRLCGRAIIWFATWKSVVESTPVSGRAIQFAVWTAGRGQCRPQLRPPDARRLVPVAPALVAGDFSCGPRDH